MTRHNFTIVLNYICNRLQKILEVNRMNGFMDKLAEKIMPLANKLGQNRYLTVLRDAFMLSFPLTMFGSIVVVINNLPFLTTLLKECYLNSLVTVKMRR